MLLWDSEPNIRRPALPAVLGQPSACHLSQFSALEQPSAFALESSSPHPVAQAHDFPAGPGTQTFPPGPPCVCPFCTVTPTPAGA